MVNKEDYYIYVKDKNGKRTGTVICIIEREGLQFHGEAICSEQDQFCRKTGKTISKGRAEARYKRYLDRKAAKNG